MHKVFKEGLVRRHSSTLKPYLREQNKRERLRFCSTMIDEQTVHTDPKFRDMRNIIHIDEKWFNGTKKNKTFYMLPSEDDPVRTVQNKNFIDKVMFLVAVAGPRYDEEGNCYFDGKLGIWPFVRQVMQTFVITFFLFEIIFIKLICYILQEPAKRSDNRPRGTLISKDHQGCQGHK